METSPLLRHNRHPSCSFFPNLADDVTRLTRFPCPRAREHPSVLRVELMETTIGSAAAPQLSPPDQYAALLRASVEMPDGGLLAAARAFGLEAVRSGATLGDVLEWHQRALGSLLHDSRSDCIGNAPVVAHDMLIATL